MEINNIADIAAFIASVKTGSFTAAATQMGLTRSTVGKRIARLEQQLGVRLFQRTTRQLTLTDEGALFAEHCQAALDELEQAGSRLAQRHREPIGKLRLSLPVSLGKSVAASVLVKYRARYPKVQLALSLSDRYADLVEDGFDAALRIGGADVSGNLSARTVGEQKMICAASPNYLAKHGTPETPDDLANHHCLHFINAQGISPWHFQTGSKTIPFTAAEPLLTADNGEALIPFALNGLGIVNLPSYLLNEYLATGELVPILTDYQTAGTPIRLVYPSKRYLSPKVRAFIDLVVEEWGV